MKDSFTEMFEDLRSKVINRPEETKPLYAFNQIGLILYTFQDLKKSGSKMAITNKSMNDLTKFKNEMAEIGKSYITGHYFQGYDENKASQINYEHIYEKALQEANDHKDKEDKTMYFIILGRTYTIHYLFEKYETPKARELYYKIVG